MNRFILMILATLALAGCQAASEISEERVPPDFSLVVCFDPMNEDTGGETYVVEPNGTLRAATGPGCTLDTFPEPTAVLTHAQMLELYTKASRIVSESETPTQPGSWLSLRMTANQTTFRKAALVTRTGPQKARLNKPESVTPEMELLNALRRYAGIAERFKKTGTTGDR